MSFQGDKVGELPLPVIVYDQLGSPLQPTDALWHAVGARLRMASPLLLAQRPTLVAGRNGMAPRATARSTTLTVTAARDRTAHTTRKVPAPQQVRAIASESPDRTAANAPHIRLPSQTDGCIAGVGAIGRVCGTAQRRQPGRCML